MAGITTDIGNQKLLVATPLQPITMKYVVLGTGTGDFDGSITNLKNEVWRGDASAAKRESYGLSFTAFVPASIGGVSYTEWGLIDTTGDLIIYGQFPQPVFKPIGMMTWEPVFPVSLDSGSTNLIITDSLNFDHNYMNNRDQPDSHPIESITGLEQALIDLNTASQAVQGDYDLNKKIKVITDDYVLTPEDAGSFVINASKNIVITMAQAWKATSVKYVFLRVDANTQYTVTLQPTPGDEFCGEGFMWPSTHLRQYEPFIFYKMDNVRWSGVRGSRAQVTETNNVPSFVVHGANIGRLLLEGNVVNSLNSTNTLNPLSAAQGNILNDQAFGVDQTWQTPARSTGTTYTNSTNKTIIVAITVQLSDEQSASVNVDGVQIASYYADSTSGSVSIKYPFSFPVRPNGTYSFSGAGLNQWREFRT